MHRTYPLDPHIRRSRRCQVPQRLALDTVGALKHACNRAKVLLDMSRQACSESMAGVHVHGTMMSWRCGHGITLRCDMVVLDGSFRQTRHGHLRNLTVTICFCIHGQEHPSPSRPRVFCGAQGCSGSPFRPMVSDSPNSPTLCIAE